MAKNTDLEAEGVCLRTRFHTEWLTERYDKKELWKRWGIISDVKVKSFSSYRVTMYSTIATAVHKPLSPS